MEIILTYLGNEILVIILGSKRGRNVGPRPHRPLLPQRLDRAPGKVIILLCCTDLTVGCISQVAGDLSRVLQLLLLLTAPPRSRPPCSVLGTPCPCSWLERWSPLSSSGWWSQSSSTLTGVLGSPGPSNVDRFEIAVLFFLYLLAIQMILPHQKVSPLCTFFSVPSHNFPEYPTAHPFFTAGGVERVSLNKWDSERNAFGLCVRIC